MLVFFVCCAVCAPSGCKEITSGNPYVNVVDDGCFIIHDILFSGLKPPRATALIEVNGRRSTITSVTIHSCTMHECQCTKAYGCIYTTNVPEVVVDKVCVSTCSCSEWYLAYAEATTSYISVVCNESSFVKCATGIHGVWNVQGTGSGGGGGGEMSVSKFSYNNATKCETFQNTSRQSNYNYAIILCFASDCTVDMMTVIGNSCGNVFSCRNKGSWTIEMTNLVDNTGVDIIQSSVDALTWSDSVFSGNKFSSFYFSEKNQWDPGPAHKMTLSNSIFADGDELTTTDGLTTSGISYQKNPATLDIFGLNTQYCEHYAPSDLPTEEPPSSAPSEVTVESDTDPETTSGIETTDGDQGQSDNHPLSPGAITGIAVSVILLIAIVVIVVLLLLRRRRLKDEKDDYVEIEINTHV